MSLAATLGVTICLLVVGFVTLAYALVAFDALARRWFHWRHRVRQPRRWRFRTPVFRTR